MQFEKFKYFRCKAFWHGVCKAANPGVPYTFLGSDWLFPLTWREGRL